jgi:IclR family transcriptional regulator, KDG regulon repressor
LGGDEAVAAGGLGVVRLAELVGREKSQVSRALRTLADRGVVERDPDTLVYRLGWRVFVMAARAGEPCLVAAAPRVLRGLVERLGETAHLSVLDGAEVVTVLSEAPPSAVRAAGWTGRRVPAHCTSSGRALLLDRDRADLAARFAAVRFDGAGPRAPVDLDDLVGRLAAARARGYALADEELERGLVALAAPVRDFRNRIVAALNVSAPRFRLARRLAAVGREVRAAADELSDRLGAASSSRVDARRSRP